MTQDELAAQSGVSKSSISQAERAFHQHPPKEITQSHLARALQITLAELRLPPPPRKPIETLADRGLTLESLSNSKGTMPIMSSEFSARDMGNLRLPTKWILGATDVPENVRYYVVTDSAMQPTIKPGDVAMLESYDTIAPGLYLVGERVGDETNTLGIRRVMPTTFGKVRVSCDNERFDRTNTASNGEIVVIAKVLLVVRAFEPE